MKGSGPKALIQGKHSKWCHEAYKPIQYSDGIQACPIEGAPQGGVMSRLVANLLLHYAFDNWMTKRFPGVRFERYADDIVIHCATEEEMRAAETAPKERLTEPGITVWHLSVAKIGRAAQDPLWR
jgi:hypothetical protein